MSYEDHAARLQARAEKEHALWLSTLTPEQYQEALKYNVITPPRDTHKVGGHSPEQKKDLAESPRASEEIDIAEEIDTLAERLADAHKIPLEAAQQISIWHTEAIDQSTIQHQAEIIQNIVAGILSAENPKLAAAGIAFATRLDALNGLNQTQFADDNNITRQAVSKCTKHWQKILGVPPSAHQKSESACKSYQHAAATKHWRNKLFTIKNILEKTNN